MGESTPSSELNVRESYHTWHSNENVDVEVIFNIEMLASNWYEIPLTLVDFTTI